MLKLFKFFNTETKVDKCLFSRHMCQALLPKQGGACFDLHCLYVPPGHINNTGQNKMIALGKIILIYIYNIIRW